MLFELILTAFYDKKDDFHDFLFFWQVEIEGMFFVVFTKINKY